MRLRFDPLEPGFEFCLGGSVGLSTLRPDDESEDDGNLQAPPFVTPLVKESSMLIVELLAEEPFALSVPAFGGSVRSE